MFNSSLILQENSTLLELGFISINGANPRVCHVSYSASVVIADILKESDPVTETDVSGLGHHVFCKKFRFVACFEVGLPGNPKGKNVDGGLGCGGIGGGGEHAILFSTGKINEKHI
jgi:hypothetical protein